MNSAPTFRCSSSAATFSCVVVILAGGLLVDIVGSIPISGIARDVKSDLLLLDRIRGNSLSQGQQEQQQSQKLKVPAGV